MFMRAAKASGDSLKLTGQATELVFHQGAAISYRHSFRTVKRVSALLALAQKISNIAYTPGKVVAPY